MHHLMSRLSCFPYFKVNFEKLNIMQAEANNKYHVKM